MCHPMVSLSRAERGRVKEGRKDVWYVYSYTYISTSVPAQGGLDGIDISISNRRVQHIKAILDKVCFTSDKVQGRKEGRITSVPAA